MFILKINLCFGFQAPHTLLQLIESHAILCRYQTLELISIQQSHDNFLNLINRWQVLHLRINNKIVYLLEFELYGYEALRTSLWIFYQLHQVSTMNKWQSDDPVHKIHSSPTWSAEWKHHRDEIEFVRNAASDFWREKNGTVALLRSEIVAISSCFLFLLTEILLILVINNNTFRPFVLRCLSWHIRTKRGSLQII